ncbi:alpha/beta fold hydrolase [Paremcibacter congregatus]|uniref:alpha/beta fold hydrolase n=1 Tax=Paremcibacter congregatus TaxID=2043170 RepID=UPI003A925328
MVWQDFPNLRRKGQVNYLTAKDGCHLRTASWPTDEKSKAIIVLVNGHREYMEKYSEFITDLLARDLAVYTLDNRGQGLSDRLLSDRLKSYIPDFDLFVSDLDEYVSQVVKKDPRATELPICLIGHSMGGNICLRYLHEHPGHIDKAVLFSPMLGMTLGSPFKDHLARTLISGLCRIGLGKAAFPGQAGRFSRAGHQAYMPKVTHDADRFRQETDFLDANPDHYVGGPTFAWLRAALISADEVMAPGYMDVVTLPLLAILAGEDTLVDNRMAEKIFAERANVKQVTIDGARHEVYRELDRYRDILWRNMDEFLALQ